MTITLRASVLLLAAFCACALQEPPANPPAPASTGKAAGPLQPWGQMTRRERAEALKAPAFSERVAQAALDQLLGGFQDLNPVRVMSVFDRDKLADYPVFDERVHSLMMKYDGFRGFFHVESVSQAGSRGSATAAFQFERISSDGSTASTRRNGEVHIQMERGAKGWKIVAFEPRGFFTE